MTLEDRLAAERAEVREDRELAAVTQAHCAARIEGCDSWKERLAAFDSALERWLGALLSTTESVRP
jgi:hypothetical protein